MRCIDVIDYVATSNGQYGATTGDAAAAVLRCLRFTMLSTAI